MSVPSVHDSVRPEAPVSADAPAGWRWAPYWVLAYVVWWPIPVLEQGILALGAVVAIARLLFVRFRGGSRLLSPQAWALTSVLFFAYWLPELFASFDALDRGHALRAVLVDLRYLPALWLAAAAVAGPRERRITFTGLALIVGIWALDALVEAGGGRSPLYAVLNAGKVAFKGGASCSAQDIAMLDRVAGVFGPCNLKLGVVLASLSPFALHAAGSRFGRLGWLASAVLMGAAIVLAGSRASWVTFGLVLLLSGWRMLGWKRLIGVFALGAALLAALAVVSPHVRDRVARTAHALSADHGGVDSALSGRGRIWGAACMAKQHPINGVGPRAFRDAFADCDPAPAQRAEWGIGPALHAHQLVLEILSETGALGLLLWLAGVAMARRAWRYAEPQAREAALPAMIALVATVFPLNTHLAFYSSFWGGVTLTLAALYAGSLLGRGREIAS